MAPTPLSKALKERRPVYFRDKDPVEIPVYERELFGCGTKIAGPCIVEEKISTTLIPSGCTGLIDEFENIVITFQGS